MTGQVINFRAAVTAEQISSVQTRGTEIFTVHLLSLWSRFRLLDGRAAKIKSLILAVNYLN